MAEHEEGNGANSPEGDESQRLPSSTIWPLAFAGGIAILLVGLIFSWAVFAIGAAIAVVFGLLWIIDVVRKPRAPASEGEVAADEPEAEASEEPERFGRDKFLELSTLGLGALIGAAVTIPVIGFAVAPAFIGQGDEDVDLGSLENYPEGGFVVATFRSREGQGEVSRQTAYVRNNGIENEVPSFTIISNHCVHLGCPVQPGGPSDNENPKEVETDSGVVTLISTQPSSFLCPCHGGAYDTEGNRTAGPPVRALDRYEYSIVNGNLVLGVRYSVGHVEGTGATAQIWKYTRYDPGEPVENWEWVLYPVSPRGPR